MRANNGPMGPSTRAPVFDLLCTVMLSSFLPTKVHVAVQYAGARSNQLIHTPLYQSHAHLFVVVTNF